MEIARLLIDFGLFVLIWMVQLIVYPGFTFYTAEDLLKWHKTYTWRITVIVAPLMFAQLGLSGYIAFHSTSWSDYIHLGLVLIAWWLTFIKAVPLHNQIEGGKNPLASARSLVKTNLPRALTWTGNLLISLWWLIG